MKNLKIVLTSLLLVAGIVAFSSFRSKNFKTNAFSITCFYYDASVSGDPTDPASWSPEGGTGTSVPDGRCDDLRFLCAICFDPTHTSPSYALDNGKPNATVLQIVADNFESLTSQGEEIVTGTTPNQVHTGIIVYQKTTE